MSKMKRKLAYSSTRSIPINQSINQSTNCILLIIIKITMVILILLKPHHSKRTITTEKYPFKNRKLSTIINLVRKNNP